MPWISARDASVFFSSSSVTPFNASREMCAERALLEYALSRIAAALAFSLNVLTPSKSVMPMAASGPRRIRSYAFVPVALMRT